VKDNYANPEISAEEWEKEIDKLTAISEQRELDVQVRWQFGHLCAKAFLPVVDKKKQLQILLQRQSDSGFGGGYIDISLPTAHEGLRGRYEKHVSQSGDVVLRMLNEIAPSFDDDGVDAWTDVYLSTSPELLRLITGTGPKQ